MRSTITTLLLALMASTLAHGEIYRWIEDGVPHYGDRPPLGVEAVPIRHATPAPNGVPGAAKPAANMRTFLELKQRQRAEAKRSQNAAANTQASKDTTAAK